MGDVETFVVKIPLVDIVKIVQDASRYDGNDGWDGYTSVEALKNMQSPWSVVMRDIEGRYYTASFKEQSDCAAYVASHHGGEDAVVHVLKKGVPRKNVRIDVTARFR